MGPTSFDAARITAANVRVPTDEFRSLWCEASRRSAELTGDWYVAAVVATCRWMAAVPMRTALCGGLPRSPVTLRACVARAELIEAECRDAQHDDRFSPSLAGRPGWSDGVRATLEWAWRGAAAPIDVPPGRYPGTTDGAVRGVASETVLRDGSDR